ncbi:MAG TPA: HAMP domain-containing sensor histidine kinase [Allosphingosinicella sp.]|jgi:signal transduction histidine kinase
MSGPVRGHLSAEGRLVSAEPRLLALQRAAGGEEGGPLAVPQLAALARLAARLGITISRAAVAAEGEADLELWVRADPAEAGGVDLAITGWTARAARSPAPAAEAERRSDFLRASGDWMWETDQGLRFSALSPAAAGAAGGRPADYISQPLTRLFRLEEQGEGELPLLGALAEQRGFDNQIATLRGGRGGRYRLAAIPLIDGAGRFAGFRGSATALSGAAPAPESEPQAEPDAGAFSERLDKALRAPLAHIIANAETIGAQPEGPIRTDYASYAGDIASAGRHLLALVDDLVDLQAIERPGFTPQAEEIDLADVARRAAGLLAVRAAARGVTIDAPAAFDTLPATGEFKRALQIIVNLLTNAIRYSPEGGSVWLRTDREGDLAALVVADQGKGIAPEDQARIFDKFERVDTSEPGGTGLGLYISRRLARAMGGDIALDSAPGQGARFTFTLPLRKD